MRARTVSFAVVAAAVAVVVVTLTAVASPAQAQLGRQPFRWVDRPIQAPAATFRFDAYLLFDSSYFGAPYRRHNRLFFFGGVGAGITDDIEIGMTPQEWPSWWHGWWFYRAGGLLPLELAPEFDYLNPSFHFQYRFLHEQAVELAFRVEMVLPVQAGSDFTLELGVPLLVRLGDVGRLDLGFYLGLVFSDPTAVYSRIPIGLSFNITPEFFLGVNSGVNFDFDGNAWVPFGTLFGFTFGPSTAPIGDAKFGFQLPDVEVGFDFWQIFGGATFYVYL